MPGVAASAVFAVDATTLERVRLAIALCSNVEFSFVAAADTRGAGFGIPGPPSEGAEPSRGLPLPLTRISGFFSELDFNGNTLDTSVFVSVSVSLELVLSEMTGLRDSASALAFKRPGLYTNS